jgi:uncharacterized protein YecT (DUF1311 family)
MKKILLILSSLTGLALAYDPTGVYKYQEKGYSGEMKIEQIRQNPKIYQATIETINNGTTHMCELSINGYVKKDTQDLSSVLFTGAAGDPEKFIAVFSGNAAKIDIPKQSQNCGMSGYFGGKWKKVNTFEFDSTNTKLSDDEYLALKRMSTAYSAADSELNKAFSTLRKTLSSEGKEQLKNDQKNWIQTRDQKLIASSQKGSQAYTNKLIQLTQERTAYLRSLSH